ncbi:hypothetical protein PIB30_005551 [Stylosanthes scabra]|uniref:Uncharacterized protein n=1 Tax=Stylosanthes scabra TaxID=79078 RepID=A0ABU6Q415_9FABA|nr:hypothetical protein [Stylosanthes scabra]
MVKADRCLPRPHHVAWRYPYLNCFGMLEDPNLLPLPACLNSTTPIFPAVNAFQGLAVPAMGLKTEPTDELKEFLQHPSAKPSLKEEHNGGSLQNANPESLQRKLLIFDRSGNKTRMFYGPALPLVQSPIISATEFPLACDINEKGRTSSKGQKGLANCSLPEQSDNDDVVHEESEMHEDTDEINALLYSDDDDENDYDDCDDDEVTSTDRSPLVTKRIYDMQEQFQHTNEEVASYDRPNKRPKIVDGGYNRSSQPVDSSSLLKPNENYECVSDAESQNSGGWTYSAGKVGNSMAGDFWLKKDKIRESLRVLESLIPGAKGKEPLFVIDQTIEYLKSLASKTQTHGVRNN